MIYGNIPSVSKYDENTRDWFVFGHRNGLVDLCDGTNDVATCLRPEDAEKLIAAKAKFNEEIRAIVATFLDDNI